MSAKPDYARKKFAPLLDKTLTNALAHRIKKEFPRMGGNRICRLCAQMVLEVVNAHLRPRQSLRHGQIIWMAISVDDPPARGKRTADTEMIPVMLDLVADEDIEAYLDRKRPDQRLEIKAVRLSHQAYEQKALLSNCDLAAILSCDARRVSQTLAAYERRTGQVVPRRATIHDMGSGLTHKRIICLKRFRDGKPAHEIARETYHSIEAVDRYLGQYDRVRHCRLQGMRPEMIAYTLACSLSLVHEYLSIDAQLETKND